MVGTIAMAAGVWAASGIVGTKIKNVTDKRFRREMKENVRRANRKNGITNRVQQHVLAETGAVIGSSIAGPISLVNCVL